MRWKSHVRCGGGEKKEIISSSYLFLCLTCPKGHLAIFEDLVKGMLQHAEEFFVPTGRATLLRKLAEQAIYDRTILNIA